jgi:hypothetical protein
VTGIQRLTWMDDEPLRLERELKAMPAAAPRLDWTGEHWAGELPVWPFDRPESPGLHDYLGGRRFFVEVRYYESFPMVAPLIIPMDPVPPMGVWTMSRWHVAGDGSLCLFQNFTDWDPFCTAADLVPKAAGWFLEYLLMSDGAVDEMTTAGIVADDSLDHLFTTQ